MSVQMTGQGAMRTSARWTLSMCTKLCCLPSGTYDIRYLTLDIGRRTSIFLVGSAETSRCRSLPGCAKTLFLGTPLCLGHFLSQSRRAQRTTLSGTTDCLRVSLMGSRSGRGDRDGYFVWDGMECLACRRRMLHARFTFWLRTMVIPHAVLRGYSC